MITPRILPRIVYHPQRVLFEGGIKLVLPSAWCGQSVLSNAKRAKCNSIKYSDKYSQGLLEECITGTKRVDIYWMDLLLA